MEKNIELEKSADRRTMYDQLFKSLSSLGKGETFENQDFEKDTPYLRLIFNKVTIAENGVYGLTIAFKNTLTPLDTKGLGLLEIIRGGFLNNDREVAYLDVFPSQRFNKPKIFSILADSQELNSDEILLQTIKEGRLMSRLYSDCNIHEIRTSTGYFVDLTPKPIQKLEL